MGHGGASGARDASAWRRFVLGASMEGRREFGGPQGVGPRQPVRQVTSVAFAGPSYSGGRWLLIAGHGNRPQHPVLGIAP